MNVNELIKNLRLLKKEGKITGEEEVVFHDEYAKFTQGDGSESQVQTVNNTFVKTARLEEPMHGDKGTRYGKLVDGRGKPKGTEKVVGLV